MEPLYAKLYDRYTKLKGKKFGELEELNKVQEEKFINHVAAADELIQYLREENDSLLAKVNELMASARPSTDRSVLEHQKLLMEEIHKNKELSQEVERLRELQSEGAIPAGKQQESDMSNGPRSRSKRRRDFDGSKESILGSQDINEADIEVRHSKKCCTEETMSLNALEGVQQPDCCRGVIGVSGDLLNDKSTSKCLFQALIQYILGMEFSVVSQKEGICITALHESSGYSFSLTWAAKGSGEVEMMYNVESLGTYERVAPQWMREVIKFSTSMCPVFFERVTRVIKLHHGAFR